MAVFGMWHGGTDYSHGDRDKDIERFRSIAHAVSVLREREDNGGWRPLPTYYVHREADSTLFPTVQDSTMDLYASEDSSEPFARLSIGPRGGVRRSNY